MDVDFDAMDTPATLWSATASSVIWTELQAEKINIVNKAVGKINSSIFIDNNFIGSSYIIKNNTENNKTNTELITLDDYLIDTKPDLIFMDVDGF